MALFTGLVSGCREVTEYGPSSGALPIFQTSLIFRGKCCKKRGLKTGSNIITDILNKEPEQPVGNIFIVRFIEADGNLEERLTRLRVLAWL